MTDLTLEKRAEWREELEASEEMYVEWPVEFALALFDALDGVEEARDRYRDQWQAAEDASAAFETAAREHQARADKAEHVAAVRTAHRDRLRDELLPAEKVRADKAAQEADRLRVDFAREQQARIKAEKERGEARLTKDMHKERYEDAEATLAALRGRITAERDKWAAYSPHAIVEQYIASLFDALLVE